MLKSSHTCVWLTTVSTIALAFVSTASAQTNPTVATLSQSASPSDQAEGNNGGIQEVVVTARQRAESLQHVPVAVSAFSQAALKAERIDSGQDLVTAVPNLNYVNSTLSNSFSIRGIGYQVVATAADTGVGIAENNAPLVVSRLSTADFFDVERIEVLRGPQGTLYGRNATGGVINSITAKPSQTFSGSLTGEYGSYNTVRLQGYVNIPLSDAWSLRLAGTYLRHDGYQTNITTGDKIDSRDLYSTRATLAFDPNSKLHTYLMWEHFDENDSFDAGAKAVCAPDPGPSAVGGVAVTNAVARNLLSRGCLRTSVYDPASSTGQPNPLGTLYALNYLAGQLSGTPTLLPGGPRGFRDVAEDRDPAYKVQNDIVQFGADYEVANHLTLKSLTTYTRDHLYSTAYGTPETDFASTPLSPSGLFNDPRFGLGTITTDETLENDHASEWTQEFRLQSNFQSPINFNVGVNYLHLDRKTLLAVGNRAFTDYSEAADAGGGSIYVDPGSSPNGQGHNYYYGLTPYTLTSYAAFGEVYWQMTNDLRLTGGVRYSVDDKKQYLYPIELFQPGEGFPADIASQSVTFREPTGRVVLDWSPHLSFTNSTLLYASYSRGYKVGGFNPPDVVAVAPAYAPEFINAYEVGTKNTLLDGKLQANLTGFFYDYTGYQIGQVVGLTTSTVNVNATVKGAEFESIYQPLRDLRFNFSAGYTNATISGGSSVNVLDRTADDPSLVLLSGITSRCVASGSSVAPLVALIDKGVLPPTVLLGACPSATAPNGAFASSNPAINPLAALGVVIPTSNGVPIDLKGKDLPNTPHWTLSLGAQYIFHLGGDWDATLRGDEYYQSSSFATIYNDFSDKFSSYTNLNLALTFSNKPSGWTVGVYAKNVFNKDAVTGVLTGTDLAGLFRTTFSNDPRIVGVTATKTFR